MTIWRFQTQLSERLLEWSMTSAALGVVMMLGRSFWRGVGSQFLGWAGINALIAYFGAQSARKKMAAPNAADPETLDKEANNLRTILLVNTALDVLYVRGGLWMAVRRRSSFFTRGMGIGIMIQGAFLFVFDLVHSLEVPSRNESASTK